MRKEKGQGVLDFVLLIAVAILVTAAAISVLVVLEVQNNNHANNYSNKINNTCTGDCLTDNCNNNGQCDNSETIENCPLDCAKTCVELGGQICPNGKTCSAPYTTAKDTARCCAGGNCITPIGNCSSQNANVCNNNENCSGNWITASGTDKCCNGNCMPKTCSEQSGNICSGNENCNGNIIPANDTIFCCNALCELKTCAEQSGYSCTESQTCSTPFIAAKGTTACCSSECDGTACNNNGTCDTGETAENCQADCSNAGTVFFISTEGNDNWSGLLAEPNEENTNGPFATLEKARDAIRELKQKNQLPKNDVNVLIRGGTYSRDKTFELTSNDSGTADAKISYGAYGNEKPIFTGGKEISGFNLVNASSPIWLRLAPIAKGKIMQVNLNDFGITNFGKLQARGFAIGRNFLTVPAALELFFNNKPMTLARYPNNDWMKIIKPQDANITYNTFSYEGDRPQNWANAQNIWIHDYGVYNWADAHEKVASIDTIKRIIKIEGPQYNAYGYQAGKRFYFQNILEELDSPEEFYVDYGTGMLYFWPATPITEGKAIVSIMETPIISLNSVSYLNISGLTLEASRGEAINVSGGTNNLISKCIIRDIGTNAISIANAGNTEISGCEIYEIGDSAIFLSGGDRNTLTPGNNLITNNHIHDFARWDRTYQVAIRTEGVGNIISHNLIHDAPHAAISAAGNDNVIEFNDIHHVVMDTDDAGAFYIGRNWTMRGNIIRYNYFHDLPKTTRQQIGSKGFGVFAVYIDDMMSGYNVFGNVFYNLGAAVVVNRGRDNVIENNVFVNTGNGIGSHADNVIVFNYMSPSTASDYNKTFWWLFGLSAVPFDQPLWANRYPTLANIIEDEPFRAKGNKVLRNVKSGDGNWTKFFNYPPLPITGATNSSPIVVTLSSPQDIIDGNSVGVFWVPNASAVSGVSTDNSSWIVTKIDDRHFSLNGSQSIGEYTGGGILYKHYYNLSQNNWIQGDPRFVDAANQNFQLRDDSPVWALGFQRIPIEQIGLLEKTSN